MPKYRSIEQLPPELNIRDLGGIPLKDGRYVKKGLLIRSSAPAFFTEEEMEPVNAIGANAGSSRQYNLIRESAKLYVTAQPPEYRSLLEASGKDNIVILYASDALSLILCVPEAVCAGQEFDAALMVVKNENTPPVHFSLTGDGSFIDSEDGRVHLEFRENPEERRRVYTVPFRLRARGIS